VIRYRYNLEAETVVAVECEERGWPHVDADGHKQHDNTHFDDEERAWQMLIDEAKAGLSIDRKQRERARALFDEATKTLADSAEKLDRIREKLDKRWGDDR
jgi:hypothetical protein